MIVLVSRDRERRVEDRPPARRGLEGRRGARRTEPPNAGVKVGRCPSDRLPSALEPLGNFRPVSGTETGKLYQPLLTPIAGRECDRVHSIREGRMMRF
jgi:hypothetical protein